MKKSIFIIIILFVLTGCLPIKKDSTPESAEPAGLPNPASVESVMSEQEAKEMVQQYITGMEEYTGSNGYHLEEIDTQTLKCPGCYEVSYEFRMRKQDSADVIGTADVTVTVTDGEITKVVYWDDMIGEEKVLPIQEPPLIGGQTDEHGCIIPAGYQWCEVTQKCQRLWEEPCIEDQAFNADVVAQAFLKKYPDWDLNSWTIKIDEQYGKHAAGGIMPKDEGVGGAYFFAAKTDDGWVIAADGNGEIRCDEIDPYNFPSEMIPECFDDVNMLQVQR